MKKSLLFVLLLITAPSYAQNCQELRRACEMKDSLGEVGQGNCRAYREQCSQQRRPNCAQLRKACMFKSERGETGQGNCQRYREQCP